MHKADQHTNKSSLPGNNSSKNLFFQPKLSINQPGDVYEKEADEVADKVMLMREPSSEKKFFSPPVVQRKVVHAEEEEKEKKLQKKETGIEPSIQLKENNHEHEINKISDHKDKGSNNLTVHVQTKCAHCEEEEREKKLQRKEGDEPIVQLKENNHEHEITKISDHADKGSNGLTVHVQTKCAHCEEEERKKLQRKESGNDTGGGVPAQTENYINSLSGGSRLNAGEKSFFESRMGHDFSDVRIHNDSSANESAKNINALAYTQGSNIVFGSGQYQPNTDSGKKLLAHELTHVVQQNGNEINKKPVIQRYTPEKIPDLIIENAGDTIGANIFYLDETAPSLITRFAVMGAGKLDVYEPNNTDSKDKAPYKKLDTYTIKSTVNPPPLLYILESTGFYVYAYNYKLEKHVFVGKKTTGLSDEAKAVFEKWDASLTMNNWFDKKEDFDAFQQKHLSGQFLGLWVQELPSGAGAGKTEETEEIPPKPTWMNAWEKDMNKLIKDTRAADAVSTDIPEVFKFYYSKTKITWRALASMMFEQKKVEIYLDINEKDDKQQKLSLIRDKLRIRQLSSDEPQVRSADSKDLDEELTWAYRLKMELDKKITEERIKFPSDKPAYLPDKTTIVTLEDQAGKAFLKLSVYVAENIPSNTPVAEPKATSVLKTGVLPQALSKDTPVDQLFEVVKKATLAIRGQFSKAVTSDPQKADQVLAPFPAAISVIAGRDDFKTITGASLDVHMSLNMASIVGNNLLNQTGIAYRGIYYTWDIYRINDVITEEEKKTLNSDWKKRREQLMAMMKNSQRMKAVNPVIDKKKLEERNKLLQQYNLPQIDAGKTLTPEVINNLRNDDISFGSGTKLTPDTTIAFPPDEGEYVLYCRAVTEPEGNVFRLPSEAFFPIKVLDGYTLAEENRDANLEEINDLNKQIAATEDENKKTDLSLKVNEIKTREKQTLSERTSSDLDTITRTKKLATILQGLYSKNQYSKTNIAQEIAKVQGISASETTELFQLYFTIETTNPGESQQSKLQKMIEQLTNQAKGLKGLQSNIADFKDNMAGYSEATYTPVTALVSKVTGEVYSLITMIGVKSTSSGGTEVILVDVTSHQTQGKYYGSSSKSKDGEGLKEAIQDAYNTFGKECKYGDGYIAYRIPGTNLFDRAESKPGFKQKVLEVLGYIAMAAGIAALVLGTIATGGALGVAAFALGIGAGVIGAGLAIHNIYDRTVNHRIEADVELAMDILNIIGPVLQGLSAISKVAKLSQAAKIGQMIKAGTAVEEGTETIAAIAKLHKLVQIQKAFAIIQKGEAITNLSLLGYKTFKDLSSISEAYANDPKKRAAMEWEVLKNAALAGTLAVVALRNEFKPTTAHMNEMEQLVNSGYKEKNYLELMKKSGLYDPEGKWVDPAIKSAEESTTAKEKADAEAEKANAGKSNEPEIKPEDTNAKKTDPEPAKKDEAEVKPEDPEIKPADTGTPAEKTDTPTKTDTPVTETPAATETPGAATGTKKQTKPKEKTPLLVIDKPVTQSDGSVAVLRSDGSIEITSRIGKGTGRKGFEKRLLSGIKIGLKGWHRAHSQGQGTGSESPHGIFYAPPEVNLAYQNSGIEARIREIFRITPPEFELTLTTVTKPHPNADGMPSKRLASIEYRIEISEPGQPRKYLVLEAGVKVQDSITNPKVEISAESFGADALWSVRYGDGTTLGMSANKFNALKRSATELEKQLNELIERLGGMLKTSKGDQKKIDQFHLDRFKELRDSLYEHPDMIPTIKAEMEEAAMWYPKDPLISADAQSYLNQWRGKINQGSKEHISRLLELSGSWKELITKLRTDPKANKTTLKILDTFRNNIIKRLKKAYNADVLPDASTKPESDVDLNLKGNEAGKNLINAEKEMKEEFGDNWSNLLRLNFYTEGDRLLSYTTAKMSPEAVKAFEKQLTKNTLQYSLAKMLQHAKSTPEGTERVTKMIDMLAPQDSAAIKSMADMDASTMLQKRNQLHAEVDGLQKELSGLAPDDPAYAEKSMKITQKQMEINFYSTEAYIGPGALMKTGAIINSPALKMQKVMGNLEMMEHILHETNGNIVRAMKEYEMYKYMYRISDAINAEQMDLFYDYLTKQISKVNREGAQSMTAAQLNDLYNNFMNMTNKYLAAEIKNAL